MSDRPVASTSKGKGSYSTISSASFLDLKAELGKHEDTFSKTRDLGHRTTLGVKRAASGKPSPWAKKNKGIDGRNDRDRIQYEADPTSSKHDPARLKAQLEKKALLYEKIRKGKTGGLDEKQIETLLVDFDRKDDGSDDDSDSDADDESATVPVIPTESDPLVEWTDEFGRTRLIPRSEVPRGGNPDAPSDPLAERNVHYGDQHHFPIYTPDPSVLAARAAAYAKSEPLVSHYDASAENRTKAAGFYAFSSDEGERNRQMEELKREREGTEREREKGGEGQGGGVKGEREREKEERKRKVEEKRKELERRRREGK